MNGRAARQSLALSRRAALSALGAAALGPLWTGPAQAGLPGQTIDYQWDGEDAGRPERAWFGRAYLPPKTLAEDTPRPLVVFLHGLNAALLKHRWMGGGSEGDVRAIVGKLVARRLVAPAIVAAPSSVVASQVSRGASWNFFDLDHFVEQTRSALEGVARIDPARIVVAGHSGAGCSDQGGLATLGQSSTTSKGVLAIDTCMSPQLARRLAQLSPQTHVVVGYQTLGWSDRPFRSFARTFEREVKAHPPAEGVLRELDELEPARAYHDQTVPLTLERWLGRIIPPPTED